LPKPPKTAAVTAASRSASSATISASLPPPSITTGVSVSAQAAITCRPVAAEPVNASLSTPARHSAAPVFPSPMTACNTGWSGTAAAHAPASQAPTLGTYSLGLKTTAFPAASAYDTEPSGV
jgi:hypothetical protein